MATIVIHAGMLKTGSSSIQQWLVADNLRLRDHGFTVVVSPPTETAHVEFLPFETGPVKSEWMLRRAKPRELERVGREFATALENAASRHGNIIVTGENLFSLFASRNSALPALASLARAHDIRVAYYARPQHTALEALWREMGCRRRTDPAVFIKRWSESLRYSSSRAAVRQLAPLVDFHPLPFRRDLLHSGDAVVDFATRFVGITVNTKRWANRGVPVEVANMLRGSSGRAFSGGRFNEERHWRCRALAFQDELPEETKRMQLARLVLQKFAHEAYSSENFELGWEDFVPPPKDPGDIPNLDVLDTLWEPRASNAELALLLRALDVSGIAARSGGGH